MTLARGRPGCDTASAPRGLRAILSQPFVAGFEDIRGAESRRDGCCAAVSALRHSATLRSLRLAFVGLPGHTRRRYFVTRHGVASGDFLRRAPGVRSWTWPQPAADVPAPTTSSDDWRPRRASGHKTASWPSACREAAAAARASDCSPPSPRCGTRGRKWFLRSDERSQSICSGAGICSTNKRTPTILRGRDRRSSEAPREGRIHRRRYGCYGRDPAR